MLKIILVLKLCLINIYKFIPSCLQNKICIIDANFVKSGNIYLEPCFMKSVNIFDIREISNEIISQLNKARINDLDRSLINVNEMIGYYCLF